MTQFIIRRLLQSIPTLIGASIIIFLIFAMAPGDYVTSQLQNPKMTEERAAQLRALYGLDKPLPERYISWASGVLKGDLGDSLMFKKPVIQVINDFIWNSFILGVAIMFFEWLIASIIGIYSAIRQYSVFDTIATLLVFILYSLPSFFLGLVMLKVFAVDLKWFPLGGMITTGSNYTGWAHIVDVAKHMVLPVATLTLISVGGLSRYFRANMLEVIKQDYIRTARAKGLKERTVIFKHALRNALLPLITLFTLELPSLFAGAMITERIFNWPGIGKVVLEGIYIRDYPLFLGYTMLITVLTILANILADVLYGVADPRVRLK
ncbi:peptide/nickel transport system permease protein [Thermoanaerobacter thermohydrosulfuricus]|uniref:Binding-protein-dependent transport systems inner membrane component n=4 Tax=Thermoanaerobacter TaxID=1754 RepID=B0KBJ4_THEP3|nr:MULTISPECIES: ABC transporter permease [Thermoanaerobacter]KUJ91160.1 MAG: binding-protein-dependent transport systems inner membrane component [Thermoanaerobacter thermocopriae]ABY93873.1 binding-protein-dependent transport systems inner membrane component [Thermoanaerobacter pseudethanolicus ATCC 33223]ADV78834.1 binding-protein-dependent transport systems inner membrane component [Thermoanaerobacter brockii subsp. finnii Ako-1]EMT39778.1 ABC-type dipeptide/oligopeptide/nickel transport sy